MSGSTAFFLGFLNSFSGSSILSSVSDPLFCVCRPFLRGNTLDDDEPDIGSEMSGQRFVFGKAMF